jgi:hypothetical protein
MEKSVAHIGEWVLVGCGVVFSLVVTFVMFPGLHKSWRADVTAKRVSPWADAFIHPRIRLRDVRDAYEMSGRCRYQWRRAFVMRLNHLLFLDSSTDKALYQRRSYREYVRVMIRKGMIVGYIERNREPDYQPSDLLLFRFRHTKRLRKTLCRGRPGPGKRW